VAGCDADPPPKTPAVWARLLQLAQPPPPGAPVGGVGAVGARFDWRRGELSRLADNELAGPVEVDSIGSGHQLITSARVIDPAGLPDERLLFGFYDPEYCLRVRRAGFRLLVDGDLMRTYRELAGRLDLGLHRARIPATFVRTGIRPVGLQVRPGGGVTLCFQVRRGVRRATGRKILRVRAACQRTASCDGR